MKYIKDYQQTHDIDWFFSYHGVPIHVASNGGHIPDAIDMKNNRALQHLIALKEDVSTAVVVDNNKEVLDLSSFIEYARKGFVSIDRFAGDFEEQRYHVVAYPSNGNPGEEVMRMITSVNIEGMEIEGLDNYLRIE